MDDSSDESPQATLEQGLARSLRRLLAPLPNGSPIEELPRLGSIERDFEYYLPALLAKAHFEWRRECFDGFVFEVERKSGPNEAEFRGWCILISDQTVTPIHIQLKVSENNDEIEWLVLKVGERQPGTNTMTRLPYASLTKKMMLLLEQRWDEIDWYYVVGFGERATDHGP
jgi:hypothetical protein